MSAPYGREWVCTHCGKTQTSNPNGFAYDEFVCSECEELELAEAAEYINRMRQVAREGT